MTVSTGKTSKPGLSSHQAREKACFKCGRVLPLAAFYEHSRMKDGHLNKCKECAKKDVRHHRREHSEKVRAYDRQRPRRKSIGYNEEYCRRFPEKCHAHKVTNEAVRRKTLKREPCEVCGTTDRIEAHHDDYSQPLNVRWLCAMHHRRWHSENGED